MVPEDAAALDEACEDFNSVVYNIIFLNDVAADSAAQTLPTNAILDGGDEPVRHSAVEAYESLATAFAAATKPSTPPTAGPERPAPASFFHAVNALAASYYAVKNGSTYFDNASILTAATALRRARAAFYAILYPADTADALSANTDFPYPSAPLLVDGLVGDPTHGQRGPSSVASDDDSRASDATVANVTFAVDDTPAAPTTQAATAPELVFEDPAAAAAAAVNLIHTAASLLSLDGSAFVGPHAAQIFRNARRTFESAADLLAGYGDGSVDVPIAIINPPREIVFYNVAATAPDVAPPLL